MPEKIIYRHWQPGDDDAILEMLIPAFRQVRADSYQKNLIVHTLKPRAFI